MTHIFLEESGDLGFSKNSSKYFVITILSCEDTRAIRKIVKTIHAGLRKHVKKLSGGILHAYKEKPITRKRLLNKLAKEQVKIMTISLNKAKVYTKLKDEKHVLYNYVTNILLDRIMRKKLIRVDEEITLIAAKRETNKFLNKNFESYLTQQTKKNHNVQLSVSIKTSIEEKVLQVVDFVSWAAFRRYEYKESEYYDLVKKVVIEENFLFP